MRPLCFQCSSAECMECARRVFKTSRNDGASENPNLDDHGKKYKHSFYRMLGDVRLYFGPSLSSIWRNGCNFSGRHHSA